MGARTKASTIYRLNQQKICSISFCHQSSFWEFSIQQQFCPRNIKANPSETLPVILLLFASRSRFVFCFHSIPFLGHASNQQKDFPSLSASNSARCSFIMKHSRWGKSKHEILLRFQLASQNNHCNPLISSAADCFIQFIFLHTRNVVHIEKALTVPGRKSFLLVCIPARLATNCLASSVTSDDKIVLHSDRKKTASHCVPVPSNASTEEKRTSFGATLSSHPVWLEMEESASMTQRWNVIMEGASQHDRQCTSFRPRCAWAFQCSHRAFSQPTAAPPFTSFQCKHFGLRNRRLSSESFNTLMRLVHIDTFPATLSRHKKREYCANEAIKSVQ